MPSRYEGLPYALLEAVGAGVPVIVSDIAAHFPLPEMRQRIAAVTVDDPEQLADNMGMLLADTRAREQFRDWGPNFVRLHFAELDDVPDGFQLLTY